MIQERLVSQMNDNVNLVPGETKSNIKTKMIKIKPNEYFSKSPIENKRFETENDQMIENLNIKEFAKLN